VHDAEHRAEELLEVVRDPRRTPTRMPGATAARRTPAGVDLRGSTSHCSPSSSVVSAHSSLPRGASITGPTSLRGSEGGRRAASRHRAGARTLRARDGPDEDRERGGGALLPGVPEGALHEVGCREVEVGGRHDDHRVLAARLGEQRQVGRHERNSAAVSHDR
jgi:hypothetical protein